MDKIIVTNDTIPEIREMTRNQAKAFNAAGLNPMRNKDILKTSKNQNDAEVETVLVMISLNDEMEEWILENIYPEYDFGNTTYKKSEELALATYRKTFMPEEAEIKNS